ncbi:MAG: hypothetical protein RLZZ385_2528 [Pseudomonadota bacterium]|jgi:demethylmenaquinone methyltransferase/2-methoxy-6-polyprenyl-1,4-benzoquinol methylase
MSHDSDSDQTTHFGFRKVPLTEKASLVAGVFHSVAGRYDVMNDIMSLGTHRLIKRFTTELSAVRPGQRILDLAGGTGDFTLRFASLVGSTGEVILADINESMLRVGRDRVIDSGKGDNVAYVQLDAEQLPFPDSHFDCICIAYGLRNVTNKAAALASMYRVLKPGGRVLILEFSKPLNPLLDRAYGLWSGLWPVAGKVVTGDAESYRYLVESIRMHPDQETLRNMMDEAGFQQTRFHNIMGGICAVHLGFKNEQ